MNSLFTVIKENLRSIHLVIRLSLFELKSGNRNHYLGMLWEIINPMILIGIYWFVFGYGIRGGEPIEGIEFFPWMLSGITVWFFTSNAIIQGSKSIYSRIKVISKMNFPMSVVPAYVITSKLYHHILLVIIVMGILAVLGHPPTLYILQLPYFLIANLVLLFSISLITSTLSTIIRDVQMVVQAVVRVLLYLSPILWTSDSMPRTVINALKLNPFYYIIEGYRSALLGTNWYFIENAQYTYYFLTLVLIFLWIGAVLHAKFKRSFVDYL
ncbi:ABC transporter permease [Bacillus marasmi]|uniref:ABC transporter permease n=1 Tax=Bacillus marasmi TaxID=1926279 RepID=UPI0011CCC94D|nr:ABC transporter permease [Bacillus marasmi]